MTYAALHCHTEYSLLDAMIKPVELFKRAKELGIPAVAITDHGNMAGAVQCSKAAKEAGVKYIPGQEFYFRLDVGVKSDIYHLVLLVMNDQGWKNLCTLSTLAYVEGFYRKPCIDFEMLEKYNEGLIAFSGCIAGLVPRTLAYGNVALAKEYATRFKDILGNRFFLEIWDHRMPEEQELVPQLVSLGRELGIELVATPDCHYLNRGDMPNHSALIAVGRKTTPDKAAYPSDQFYLKSYEDFAASPSLSAVPEAITNTLEIASHCSFEIDLSTKHAPKFSKVGVENNVEYFKSQCLIGLENRYGNNPSEEVKDRLRHEARVIEDLGFVDYFLILQDLLDYCREERIPVGPGRGSAAGSIVSYVLGITNIDPLRFGLLFERFLSPERISDPDIDIDIGKTRREEAIQYLHDRYGDDNVARICTFSRFHTKSVVRDVGRVLLIDYALINKLCDRIPDGDPDWNLARWLAKPPPEAREIVNFEGYINTCISLHGVIRHHSLHAAGVIIGDKPLIDLVPLRTSKEELLSQFDMLDVEEIGLLKIDVLGLRTLTVIDECLKSIDENERPILDGQSLDDEETYELLKLGKTVGVFQLESVGMRQVLLQLEPQNIEDLMVCLALFRPGPLDSGMVSEYTNRKRGLSPVIHLHPKAEPILGNTYGIMLYQEQIMKLVVALCGYTLPQADSLRKCLPEGSQILTHKNGYVPIEKLLNYKNHLVQVIDDQNGTSRVKKIEDIWSVGKKTVHKITTSSGYSIEVTEEHELLGEDGWVKLSSLSGGDLWVLLVQPERRATPR